jgi:hypothetical protein
MDGLLLTSEETKHKYCLKMMKNYLKCKQNNLIKNKDLIECDIILKTIQEYCLFKNKNFQKI